MLDGCSCCPPTHGGEWVYTQIMASHGGVVITRSTWRTHCFSVSLSTRSFRYDIRWLFLQLRRPNSSACKCQQSSKVSNIRRIIFKQQHSPCFCLIVVVEQRLGFQEENTIFFRKRKSKPPISVPPHQHLQSINSITIMAAVPVPVL